MKRRTHRVAAEPVDDAGEGGVAADDHRRVVDGLQEERTLLADAAAADAADAAADR